MERMMERMLAKMDSSQEEITNTQGKTEVNNEKFEALRCTLVSRMDAHQGKIEVNNEEWMAAIKASRERMEALMDVSLEDASLEKIEANRKNVGIRMEIGLEEIKLETIGALKERYGDRRLVVRRRGRPEKRTQGDGGSRQKPAPDRGRLTPVPFLHCARNMVVGDLARQAATESEDEAGDRSYVWETRHYMRSSEKVSSWWS
jgi:hypothetical protein